MLLCSRWLQRHLRAVWESVVLDRIPVLGYTAWSYADNYEWGTYEPPTPSLMLSWLSGGSGGTGFLASPSKNYFPGGKLVRTPPPPARMVRRNTSAVWTPGIYGKALRYRARWLGGEFPRSKVVGGVPPPTTEAPTATQLPPLDVGMGVGLHPPPWWVPKTANEIFRRREVPENCLFPSLLVYYRLLFLYAWVFFHLKNVQERHELSIFWFVFFKR